MEDAYTVANGGHFAGVYDGHGGDAVSAMLRDRLHNLYVQALPQRHFEEKQRLHDVPLSIPSIRSHTNALRGALKRIERDVLKHDDLEFIGSAAVVVIVHFDEHGQRSLLSANVGDSRAVLSRAGKAVDLTRDHKPNDEREMARIRSMGEEVEWDPYGEIYRVRDLSLSRAIGDRFAKPVVTSEAEIDCIPVVDEEDEFFVLASDGLWDVMTSQEVVDFVCCNLRSEPGANPNLGLEEKQRKMARMIANEALERGSADNVCVVLVWLRRDK
jgi:serine/threonine protein phosphatase PrpC